MTTRRFAVLPSLPMSVDGPTLGNPHELSVGVKRKPVEESSHCDSDRDSRRRPGIFAEAESALR
jgi:hypothetical protein